MFLLFEGVASHLDDLHSVQHCRVQRVQHVRSAEEQHLREIDWNVEEIVGELVVLLRIQNFEQNTTGVSLRTPLTQLVNLVD